VAGLRQIRDGLDELFSNMSGSADSWATTKASLEKQGRWVELLY
jgi:hypothetical protein